MTDYKNTNNKDEFISYRDKQIKKIDTLLKEWTEIDTKYKNSVLLSYWIDAYEKFLRDDDDFKKKSKFLKYERGQILYVNFGYRVGHELGGAHYAIVVSMKDTPRPGNITVIPLKSNKGKPIRYNQINLEDSMKTALIDKILNQEQEFKEKLIVFKNILLSIISYRSQLITTPVENDLTLVQEKENINIDFIQEIKEQYSDDSEFTKLWSRFEYISTHKKFQNLPDAINPINDLLNRRLKKLNEQLSRLEKSLKSIRKIKSFSVADVGQITTISKMRILNPLRYTDPLFNAKLPGKWMNLIDKKIKELYTKN